MIVPEAWLQRIQEATSKTCGHLILRAYWISEYPDRITCEVCASAWFDSPSARRADRSPQTCARCGISTDDPTLVDFPLEGVVTVVAWVCPRCLTEAT